MNRFGQGRGFGRGRKGAGCGMGRGFGRRMAMLNPEATEVSGKMPEKLPQDRPGRFGQGFGMGRGFGRKNRFGRSNRQK